MTQLTGIVMKLPLRLVERMASCNDPDIEAMCRALREKQKKNGRKVVSPAPRRAGE